MEKADNVPLVLSVTWRVGNMYVTRPDVYRGTISCVVPTGLFCFCKLKRNLFLAWNSGFMRKKLKRFVCNKFIVLLVKGDCAGD